AASDSAAATSTPCPPRLNLVGLSTPPSIDSTSPAFCEPGEVSVSIDLWASIKILLTSGRTWPEAGQHPDWAGAWRDTRQSDRERKFGNNRMQGTLPTHLSPRCGANSRRIGQPCGTPRWRMGAVASGGLTRHGVSISRVTRSYTGTAGRIEQGIKGALDVSLFMRVGSARSRPLRMPRSPARSGECARTHAVLPSLAIAPRTGSTGADGRARGHGHAVPPCTELERVLLRAVVM